MAYEDILDAEIAEGSPLDNTTLTKMKNNFDYLKSNIGGGGAPEWNASLFNSAFDTSDQGVHILKFSKGVEQSSRLIVSVPDGYTSGIVPSIILNMYGELSGSFIGKLSITVGLVRGTNKIESPISTRTANFDFNNPSTAKDILKVVQNLSDANGFIGAEQIVAGDNLVITLSRKGQDVGDTMSFDLFLIPSLTEIKFS